MHQALFTKCFPGGSDGKESACNAGNLCSIPGLRRSPGEGNGNPLQYSCLQNSMARGAWWATVIGSQRVGKDCVTNTFTFSCYATRISRYPKSDDKG